MQDPQLINDLIQNRRSVFQSQYTDEKVDDKIVEQMLANANWAPTHKLTEPWRFIVFTGEGINELANAQAKLYKEVTEADGTYKEERYQNLLTKPHLSSHIIAVIMKRDEKKSVPEIEELGAVFCAIQNIFLTASAYDVGCYLSTGGITYFKEAHRVFDLNDDDKLLGFLHVGKPKGPLPSSKRKPIEEKVAWVR
ncbi:MAG TPA: nitroreductase [Ohtaekwangia sp.]|nr:nitroreductase [Ohtaekwangia sp.]